MINYVIGDATNPIGNGKKIILHCCNDEQKWGSGFVLAISKKWKQPEIAYRSMQKSNMVLGYVQFVSVDVDIVVANMIGQHRTGIINGKPPIRYDAIVECLTKVNAEAISTGATLHCPRFGAGLAGGSWSKIEQIIKDTITVPITVYDLVPLDSTTIR